MNYKKIFDDLIYKRKVVEPLDKATAERGTVESHHIVMRSMGGSNDPSNLVNLTLREHYVVHELMVMICKGTPYEATAIRAWNGMSRKIGKRVKTSRLYHQLRLAYNLRAGDSVRGKVCINDGKRNKYIFPDEPLPEGYSYGQKPMSDFCRQSHKNTGEKTKGSIRVNNGMEERSVRPDQIPDGFVKGGLPRKMRVGKIWVNNGKEMILVLPNEIPEGFKPGMLQSLCDRRKAISKKMHKDMPEETKLARNAKISKSRRGKSSWAKGKHFTADHRRRLSESQRGKKKMTNPLTGHTILVRLDEIPDFRKKGYSFPKELRKLKP